MGQRDHQRFQHETGVPARFYFPVRLQDAVQGRPSRGRAHPSGLAGRLLSSIRALDAQPGREFRTAQTGVVGQEDKAVLTGQHSEDVEGRLAHRQQIPQKG